MIAALLVAGSILARPPFAPCTDHGEHQRALMKNRVSKVAMANPPVASVRDVLAWQVRPTKARLSNVPVEAREQQVYQVSGYVRLVKLSDDDCDFHVQLSASPDGDEDQIIVEIPPNQPAARAALERVIGRRVTTTAHTWDHDSPKVTVVGFAFLDLAHANSLKNWTKKGHGHGTDAVATLWEIHPVLEVK